MSLHPFGGRLSQRLGFSNNPEDPYLSYYDTRLTRHDYLSIKDDWLTDNAIAFWEEYLEKEKMNRFPTSNIVLLRPTMSFMLMHSQDPASLRSALPDFSRTTHIFLPINDAKNVEIPEAGSHWSLLVVSIIDGVAFHYDSLGRDNLGEAEILADALSDLLGRTLRFAQMYDVPQQDNGKDCGVYVCMFMETLLLDRLLQADAGRKISMSLRNEPFNARRTRRRIAEIVDAFRREGERRRSRSVSPYRVNTPPRIGD